MKVSYIIITVIAAIVLDFIIYYFVFLKLALVCVICIFDLQIGILLCALLAGIEYQPV